MNDRHLSTLAEAAGVIEADDVDLITVSPGAWLKYHPARVIRRPQFVLVVLSSATDQNHRQLERLISTMPCHVLDPSPATADPVELPDNTGATPRVIVLETITSRRGLDAGDTSLSVSAAKSAATRLGHRPQRRIALCRGGRQRWVHRRLPGRRVGSRRAGRTAEVEPLCGAGSLLGGGWDGLALITKGGLVGDDSTLSGLVTSLWDGRADG